MAERKQTKQTGGGPQGPAPTLSYGPASALFWRRPGEVANDNPVPVAKQVRRVVRLAVALTLVGMLAYAVLAL